MIRHYGLYARCKFRKVKEIIDKLFKYIKIVSQGFFSFFQPSPPTDYRSRLQNSFGIDPFKCPNCGERLILYEVWHPKHGTIYSIFRDENWREADISYVVEKETRTEQQEQFIQRDSQLSLFEMSLSNQGS